MCNEQTIMRSTAWIVIAAAMVSALGHHVTKAQGEAARRIGRDARYTIASQLRRNDRRVIIEYNGDKPLRVGGPPKGGSRLQWLSQNSQVIIVVRVEGVQSRLVHRDLLFNEREAPPDEANWIVSTVRVRIEDLVKGAGALGRAGGQLLSLRMEGGSATIRDVFVEAVVPWDTAMVVGRTYLLFGQMYNGQFARDDGYAEAANTGLLTRMIRSARDAGGTDVVPDDVEQWPLPQAIMLIREAARQVAGPAR